MATKKKKPAPKKKATKKKYAEDYHKVPWETTEAALTADLSEELLDAWRTVRASTARLGEMKIYASGKAVMFSKKVCFTFVRPKRKYLETVVFLRDAKPRRGFGLPKAVSKTKWAFTYKLRHADDVEGDLSVAIAVAFQQTDPAV